MTVILSVWDGINPIHTLSDVLLSVDGESEQQVNLPHLPSLVNVKAGSATLAGFSQKTVTLGNSTVVWAGRVVVATAIMKEFFARSNGGTEYVALSDVIRSLHLTDGERSEVGLLTFFCDRPGNVLTCGHNATNYDVNLGTGALGRLATVGSGTWDLIENYNATRIRPVEYSLPVDIIHRMALRTVEPFLNNSESFHYLYGSWFELSVHREVSFHKLPTAFKFWYRPSATEPFEENGPLVFSNYVNEDLYLTTVVRDRDTSLFKTIHVADPLGRGRPSINSIHEIPSEALTFQPQLFFQVLLTGQENGMSQLSVAPFFLEGDPLISVSKPTSGKDNRIDVSIDPSLLKFIESIEGEVDLEVDTRLYT